MLLILRHTKDPHQKNISYNECQFNNFIKVAKYIFYLVLIDLVLLQIGLFYLLELHLLAYCME